MNVKELIEYLQGLDNPEQLTVIIRAKTMGIKIGSMDYMKIRQVYQGFDWETSLVIVDPEEDLFTENGYEEWSARKKSRESRKK